MAKLNIPLPSTLKFQRMYDSDEYLQRVLRQTGFSHWELTDEREKAEVKKILIENKINYKTKL